jgi:hypothetical protein
MERSITRRDLMRRGALAGGAAAASSLVGWGSLERALAAGTLTPERSATYGALVEAVALAGTSKVSAANIERTTAQFADFYAGAPAVVRDTADRALDVVGRMPGGGRFAELDKRTRLARLRGAYRLDPQREPRWREALPAALEFVSVPFYPRGLWDRPTHIAL